jgi:hypothetical protein
LPKVPRKIGSFQNSCADASRTCAAAGLDASSASATRDFSKSALATSRGQAALLARRLQAARDLVGEMPRRPRGARCASARGMRRR